MAWWSFENQMLYSGRKTPLTRSNIEESPEPVLSLNEAQTFPCFRTLVSQSQEEWETNQMNSAPFEKSPANTSYETRELFINTKPFFSQTLDQGLFDVTTLPTTPESELRFLRAAINSHRTVFRATKRCLLLGRMERRTDGAQSPRPSADKKKSFP